ncbi:MAG: flagellar hook-associated protein 1 [Alphaproteobacteria bacterium]|jgi:flagellar hook-associated protein 1 FlgK|nr:flagellar hook-associated protein 1 [Alphaproteobacteria bacterium]
MSLAHALATAVSGLRASQAGLAIVAANVANAETPGYVRKTAVQVSTATGDTGVGVRTAGVNRELDQYVQRQLRTETSGGAYAGLRAQFYERLQQTYGDPGSASALETIFNNFTTAVQALTTSPESAAARNDVLSAGQVLAQQLNAMTGDIQGLRTDAESGLSAAVSKANDAMQQIAVLNQQLGTSNASDAAAAALLDQRDNYLNQLSQLMDIRVVQNDGNRISVFTNSGIQLIGAQASKLEFDGQDTMTPASQWSADPTKRTVGTLKLISPTGGAVDLIASKAIHSGEIAAYLEMRDQVLVQAQGQIDGIAAALSQALSDHTTDGTPAVVGAQSGFDVPIGNLSAGNTIHITYTDTLTNTQHKITVVRVDDPTALPLSNAATSDPNDTVIGINFSGGLASVVSQLNGALGITGLQFSNPVGTSLRVLDDGATGKIDVNALSATATTTSLTGGGAEFPLFLDANNPYTGAFSSLGSQSLGLAGRISVNAALLADPSKLVVYQTLPMTAAGDATRPNFIYNQLTASALDFNSQSGIGTAGAPFKGSLQSFIRQVVSQQGEAASAASSLKEGQDIVVKSLQQRFNDNSAVNIDQEMSNLLNLQNSYAANARVLSAVKEMLDTLLRAA